MGNNNLPISVSHRLNRMNANTSINHESNPDGRANLLETTYITKTRDAKSQYLRLRQQSRTGHNKRRSREAESAEGSFETRRGCAEKIKGIQGGEGPPLEEGIEGGRQLTWMPVHFEFGIRELVMNNAKRWPSVRRPARDRIRAGQTQGSG